MRENGVKLKVNYKRMGNVQLITRFFCKKLTKNGKTVPWFLVEVFVLGGSLEGAGSQSTRCFSICRITCWSVIKLTIFTPLGSRYTTNGHNLNFFKILLTYFTHHEEHEGHEVMFFFVIFVFFVVNKGIKKVYYERP